MKEEGWKDRNHFLYISACVQKCSSTGCIVYSSLTFLSSTQLLPNIYWVPTVYQMEREHLHPTHACGLYPEHHNTRAVDSTVVTVSQHYLVNKVSSAHCEFCEEEWGSSLGKMDTDVTGSSPKTVQGDIPLNDSLVTFWYSLSFLFTNYIDLSRGKDWHCEYITCFKNHLFVNEMVAWCLQRFADMATWVYLPFGRFYHI